MNIDDLQSFLRGLSTLLAAHQGKKPAADFDAFCDGLEPFRDQPIPAFAALLRDAAEYRRTGVLPVAPAGRTRKPPAKTGSVKQALKKKDDVEAIATAVASLQQFLERATDPALTHEAIEAEVARIEQAFDAEGLKAVARQFGIASGLTGKAAAKAKILNRITERKGRHERGEVIGDIARAAEAASPRDDPTRPSSVEAPAQ